MATTAKEQAEKFQKAARELETDNSEEAFDANLKRVAKAKVKASENTGEPAA